MSEASPNDASKDRKRVRNLFSFSLRTFLFIVTIAAIWLAWATSKAQKQKAAIEALAQFDSTVFYEHSYDTDENLIFHPDDPRTPGPAWLRRIVGDDFFTTVNYVSLAAGSTKERPPITDEKLADLRGHLESLPGLKSLNLMFTDEVTDAGVAELVELTSLEELNIMSPLVTSEGLVHLASLRRLRRLSLSSAYGIADDGLEQLQQFPKLEELRILGSRVTDDGLALLEHCPKLNKLTLQQNAHITDDGVQHLHLMKKLQSLILIGDNFTDKSFAMLAGHPTIHDLKTLRTSITDEGLAHLKQLPNLTSLSLSRNQITDAGMESLAQLKQLERLELDHTEVGDAGLERLSSLSKLRVLHMMSTKVSAGAPARAKQLLPQCATEF